MNWRRALLSTGLYGATALVGLLAFFYPFILPAQGTTAPESLAPLLTGGLLVAALLILFLDLGGESVGAGDVAVLGVLIAITSVLRFLEVAIPGPGGFSPIFAPIILAGYVFGARFGFLMGALTLLVSALITGGVGPWLPYQMFAAGWIGLTAGWLPRFRRPVPWLAAFGALWGVLFGALLNLYFWPFVAGGATAFASGLGPGAALARYGAFYVTTSLAWDLVRATGNVLVLLILGEPAIRALRRFQSRLTFERHGPAARAPESEPLPAD